jgi:hypothetical protein
MNARKIVIAGALAASAATPASAGNSWSGPPRNEIVFGFGSATAYEQHLFNSEPDVPSRPDQSNIFGYMRNIDEHLAVGVTVYGTGQDDLRLPAAEGQEMLPAIPFDLYTYTVALRVRYTFMPGPIAPYAYAGLGPTFGELGRGAGDEVLATYDGLSWCVGPGVGLELGKHFKVSGEGIISTGDAHWQRPPRPGAKDLSVDPSFSGLLVTFSFTWGR